MTNSKRTLRSFVALLALVSANASAAEKTKQEVISSIERQRPELIRLSDQVWAFAETALRETKSSKVLADYAEQQGFKVERGVAGMPTAFVASYGSGKPVIGILGEFDALPGLSQKAQTTKEPLQPGAAGHACGHNLFGAASLGAATALKELIAEGRIKGTIKYFGTPAEESVGGKIYMARDGHFKDVDVVLAWHPADETRVDVVSTQALIDFIIEFHGKAAHAAFDPWNGRSAVDALELCTHGINLLREHVKPSVRMHYTIQSGGDVPNVVPEYAKLWCWVRDWSRTGVDEVFKRVQDIAAGAALMAGVEAKVTVQGGDYEMLVNFAGARLMYENLVALGPIQYTQEEQDFAKAIQRATGKPEMGLDGTPHPLEGQIAEGGSTDVGDISWNVPTLHVSVTTAPVDTPWHSWPVVACGGMSIGHKGLIHAAKVLAMTAVDLFENAAARETIRSEFTQKTNGHTYKAYIPDGPPPIPAQ